MATYTAYAGDTWTFETTLLDANGNGITAVDNAWLSVNSGKTDEKFSYDYSDAEMTLTSNVLTTVVPPAVTTLIPDGTYYVDVKVQATGGGHGTVTYRDRLRVINQSPLYNDI